MRWRPGPVSGVAPLALLVAGAASGQEFVRTVAGVQGDVTVCVAWSQRGFVYRVDPAGSARTPGTTELQAVELAFRTWQALSDTCSDFTFTRGPDVSRPRVGQGSTEGNVVVFRDQLCADVVPPGDGCVEAETCADTYHCWEHSVLTIGLTTVTFNRRTGVASDADIELNSAQRLFTTVSAPPCVEGGETPTCVAFDVQATMTHEIGHVVGFDHVPDVRSLMAPTASVGETNKRVIDVGTARGFCELYPRGDPPVPCDETQALQRRVSASTAGCEAPGAGEGFLLAVVALGGSRRRLTLVAARLQGR